VHSGQTPSTLSINADRLWQRIEELAAITDPDRPYSRVAFSHLHAEGRQWLTGQMKQAGLDVRVDAGANLIGRLAGSENGRAAIVSGSHTDTVPRGGRFDGIAGVLVALEVAQTLAENGERLRHPFEVVDFLAEEPNKYGFSCIGSRAIAGVLTEQQLAYVAADGTSTAEGISAMGGDPERLGPPLRDRDDLAGFFELHIEQGVVLEQDAVDIGIVTDIVGITRYRIRLTGEAAHAGTTPMNRRKDALVAAAILVQEAETLASTQQTDGAYLVATVGKLDVVPNGSNVVPGFVDLAIEVRSNSNEQVDRFYETFLARCREVCNQRDIALQADRISDGAAIGCDQAVQSALVEAAEMNRASYVRMPSGAGHDAAYMARIGPSGMIFIPCLKGRSHCPEEWADKKALATGAQVMLDGIRLYDRQL